MKYLNVDAVAPKIDKTVEIAGVKYEVDDMSVETFIETVKEAKALENVKDTDKHLEASVRLAQRYLPKCPAEVLRRLKLEQLGAIIGFCQETFTTDENGMPILPAADELEAAEGGEKK